MNAIRFFQSNKAENEKEIERLNQDIQSGIIQNVEKQLESDDINFTGDLSQSFKPSMDGIFHTVESNNPYAGFIEFGMPAGRNVSFGALRIWVEGKLGIGEGDELDSVTWKIFHAIKANGIQPRRYMKKAILAFAGKHGFKRERKSNGSKGKRRNSVSFAAKVGKIMKKLLKTAKAWNKKGKKFGKMLRRSAKKFKREYKKAERQTKSKVRTVDKYTKPINKGYKRPTKEYRR